MEKILCAAILYKSIQSKYGENNDIIISGYRHADIILSVLKLTGLRTVTSGENSTGSFVQGFLTSDGRFVNRKEAMLIAKENNQLIRDDVFDELYSEDIY